MLEPLLAKASAAMPIIAAAVGVILYLGGIKQEIIAIKEVQVIQFTVIQDSLKDIKEDLKTKKDK